MNVLNGFIQKKAQGVNYYEGGDGPTIVLLHGLPENAGLWRKVAPALAQRHHLIGRGFTRDRISSEGYWRPGRIGGHDHVED